MKKYQTKYCIGLFFIVFISLSVIPVVYVLEKGGGNGAVYMWQPSWFYALALLTAFISAVLCEWRSSHLRKSV